MCPHLSLQRGNREPDVLLTGEWQNKCQEFLQIPAEFSRRLFSFLQRRVCQRSWKALSTCGRRAEWRMSSLLRRSRWCGTSDIITGYSCHAGTMYKSRVSLESMAILRWHLNGLELSGAYFFSWLFCHCKVELILHFCWIHLFESLGFRQSQLLIPLK